MVAVRKRGESIRQFILDNVEHHPKDIVALTSHAFEISSQALSKQVKRLVDQNALFAAWLINSVISNHDYWLFA